MTRLNPWLWICALAAGLVISALVCRCAPHSPACPIDTWRECVCSDGEHGNAYCVDPGVYTQCYCAERDGGEE